MQANKEVESMNKQLIMIFAKTMSQSKRHWHKKVPTIVWSYNMMFLVSIGFTPFMLVYGQDCVLHTEYEINTLRKCSTFKIHIDESL